MVDASVQRQNTLRAYDAIAPLYAEYSEKYRNYLSAVDAMAIEHLKPGMRLLDVGSGDGRRLAKITSAVGLTDVVSVEPSKEMAALCRKATGFNVYEMCGDTLSDLPEAPFDAMSALWNVFGHMANSELRIKTLVCMAGKLKPEGFIMLDVNNRHNQLSYGRWNVFKRRIIDVIAFDETRGDAYYDWNIGGQSFLASGHLFTPGEMAGLFARAGLRVTERWSINYATGERSKSPFNGQLFYVLKLA